MQKLVSQFKLLGGDERVLVSFPDALADSIKGLSGKEATAISKKWARPYALFLSP
ncbi:MAG: hypothetical protein JNM69_14360 [Archangium sp.]|nr:hypothetical protein [Archangium sp.]